MPKHRIRTWLARAALALALTGLGFALDATLPPHPRMVLRGDDHYLPGNLSSDGKILAIYTTRPTKGGGIAYESIKTWDTISGSQRGEFLVETIPQRFSPLDALLRQPIETTGLTANIPLKNALDHISDKTGGKLMFLVNRAAFSADLGADAPDPDEEEVRLPPLVPAKMAINDVLQILLAQVGKGNATYLVRRNFIEITTTKHRFEEKVLPPFARASFALLSDCGRKGNKLHVVDCAAGRIIAGLSPHAKALGAWGLSPDQERLIFFANDDGQPLFTVWSTRTRQVVRTFKDIEVPKFHTRAFIFAPDSKTLLAIQDGRSANLLNLRSGEMRHLILATELHWGEPRFVAFSPDSKRLVVLAKSELQVWDVATGTKRRSIQTFNDVKAEYSDFCISEDWSLCAEVNQRHGFKVWDLETGKCLWQRNGPVPHPNQFPYCTLNRDHLIHGMADRMEILDFATGEVRASVSLDGNARPDELLMFTPDGRSVVTSWQIQRKPSLPEQWFGEWWPANPWVSCVVVTDLATGQTPFRRSYRSRDRRAEIELSDDGRTLVEVNQWHWIGRAGDDDDVDELVPKIAFWDVPPRTSWHLVYGIPLALAGMALLVRIWFTRKRRGGAAQPI